jgi:hypothetical protein
VRNDESYLAFPPAVSRAFLEGSDPRCIFLVNHLYALVVHATNGIPSYFDHLLTKTSTSVRVFTEEVDGARTEGVLLNRSTIS